MDLASLASLGSFGQADTDDSLFRWVDALVQVGGKELCVETLLTWFGGVICHIQHL